MRLTGRGLSERCFLGLTELERPIPRSLLRPKVPAIACLPLPLPAMSYPNIMPTLNDVPAPMVQSALLPEIRLGPARVRCRRQANTFRQIAADPDVAQEADLRFRSTHCDLRTVVKRSRNTARSEPRNPSPITGLRRTLCGVRQKTAAEHAQGSQVRDLPINRHRLIGLPVTSNSVPDHELPVRSQTI